MDCIIFVTVRTASTRLPKKALLKIRNKPLIKILIDHIRSGKYIKNIVVCTTNKKSDDELVEYLQNNNVEVFRGDSIDILNRLYSAAKKYKADQFVVVEGDDLFCDPFLIEETCKKLSQNKYEFLYWEDLPFGVSPLGINTQKLCILMKSKKIKNTETGWGRFIIESGLFKIGKLKPDNKKLIRPEIRLSVDYKEDFYLAKKIYENLPTRFSLIDIIKLLNKNPNWLKINESVKKLSEHNFEKKRIKVIIKKKGIKK
jgi:spore coat polysaccharide biosynthesis protein SpsF (cytidylyltransferase family)